MLEMTIKSILYDRKTIIFFGLTLFLLVLPCYYIYDFEEASKDIAPLELFIIVMMIVYMQFIVLYASLLFGCSLYTEEEDQRTMSYLISRPVSNAEIVIYKYIGFVISVYIMLAIPLLLNLAILTTKVPLNETMDFMFEIGQFFGLMFLAIAAWGAFFMFLGIYLKKFALVAGLMYAIFWETFMANIPAGIRYGTISHYLRSLAPIYVSFGDDPASAGLEATQWEHALVILIGFGLAFQLLTWFILRRKDYH